MVLLNAFKVLSAATRRTLSVSYTPNEKLRKCFQIPPTHSVFVEIVTRKDLTPFNMGEPLYAIDACLHVSHGHPYLTFCHDPGEALGESGGSSEASDRSVEKCVEKALDDLVCAALSKAEKVQFFVRGPAVLQLAVVLIKMNRSAEALRYIREEMKDPSKDSRSLIMHYIYEMYCLCLLSPKDALVQGRLVQISRFLNGSLRCALENRAANALIDGLALSQRPRTRAILSLHTHARFSRKDKHALFLYLFSRSMGRENGATKCTLLALAGLKHECKTCNNGFAIKEKIRSSVSAESQAVLGGDCSHFEPEQASFPAPSAPPVIFSVLSDISSAADTKRAKDTYVVFEVEKGVESSASDAAIFTEGVVEIRLDTPGIVLHRLLITLPECTSVRSVEPDGTRSVRTEESVMAPVCRRGRRFLFCFSSSCCISGFVLGNQRICRQSSSFVHRVSIRVEVMHIPNKPRILAHLIRTVPAVTTQYTDSSDTVCDGISRCADAPAVLVRKTPTTARIAFRNGKTGCVLYTHSDFHWKVLEVARVTETTESYEVRPLFVPLLLSASRRLPAAEVGVGDTFSIPKSRSVSGEKAGRQKLFWGFTDCSRSGSVRL